MQLAAFSPCTAYVLSVLREGQQNKFFNLRFTLPLVTAKQVLILGCLFRSQAEAWEQEMNKLLKYGKFYLLILTFCNA